MGWKSNYGHKADPVGAGDWHYVCRVCRLPLVYVSPSYMDGEGHWRHPRRVRKPASA